MASLGDLVVNLKASTGQFNSSIKKSQSVIGGFAASVAGLATGSIGLGIIKLAADAETLQVQFKVLTGSAEEAEKMVKRLGDFAATTPFSKLDLSEAAQTLLAFQFGVDEIQPVLKNLGDVAAGSGAKISDLATILGRATATGKVQGELLNQLIDRRIPILESLSQATGIATTDIQKMASKGLISGKDLRKAFEIMTGAGGQFKDGMLELSKTTAGQFSTLKDNIVAVGEAMGKVLLPASNAVLGSITSFIQTTSILPRGLLRIGVGIAAAAAAFLLYAKAAAVAAAFSGPAGWAALAVSAVAAGTAMVIIDNTMEDAAEETGKFAEAQTTAADAMGRVAAGADGVNRGIGQMGKDFREMVGLVDGPLGSFLAKIDEATGPVRRMSNSWEQFESTMQKVVKQQSGFNSALQETEDQIAILSGVTTAEELELQGFSDRLVGQEGIDRLRSLKEEQKRLEDVAKAAKEAKEEEERRIKTQKGAQKQLDQIRVNDAIAAARDRVNETKPKSGGARLAGIATRGSSEAFSSIFASRAAKVPEQALAEHKKANKTLADLLAEQKKNQTDALLLQGAV